METLIAFRASLSCVSPNLGAARPVSAVLRRSMLYNAWIQGQGEIDSCVDSSDPSSNAAS